MLRLYANSLSPFVRKVRITLYEKGVEFEVVEIERGAQRADLLRVNPRGEVPALVAGDVVVTGSSTVCDYVEERFPEPPLLPAEPAARARCRTLEHLADTQTDALQFLTHLVAVRRPELRGEHPEAGQALSAAVRRHWAALEVELGALDYFVGVLSRADVALLPHVASLGHLGEPVPNECARLRRWLDRMRRRPSVERDAAQVLAAWERAGTSTDPFFRADRIHWRGERVEWAVRIGLGAWLAREVEAGRAYFSPPAGEGWAGYPRAARVA